MGSVFTAVFLFVFPDDVLKTDEARITKFDIQMFHHEPWTPSIACAAGHQRSRL